MRRLVPVAVIAALALTLGACGSGSGSSSAPADGLGATKLIAASADKAAAAKTARMSGEVTVNVGGKSSKLPLDGILDFETGAFQFKYDFGQLGIPGGGASQIEARMVDGVMYMNLGSLGGKNGLSSVTGGKTWLKLDLAKFGAGAGGSGSAGGLGDANPGGVLDSLRGAGDVQKVGTDTLRGVETTHYRATIDPQKALAKAPAALREKAKAGLDQLKGPFPIDVWIDGDGQTRKISMDVDAAAGKVSTTIEYYDFGVDVDVSAPPASDVFDFSSLLGGFKNLGAGQPSV
jgi:LppX_LprAFG lipoprotein